MKDKIIFNVFMFLDTKDLIYKQAAIDLLTEFAKTYHIPIKKVAKIPLKTAFTEFILNENGYIITINKLIFSL